MQDRIARTMRMKLRKIKNGKIKLVSMQGTLTINAFEFGLILQKIFSFFSNLGITFSVKYCILLYVERCLLS